MKAVVFQQQPLPINVLKIDQGLSKADAPEFSGLTVGGYSVIPANRQVLDLVTQSLVDHPSRTDNPHAVTAVQVGADPVGTAADAVQVHLGEFAHDDIYHHNRAEIDSVNQPLGTASNVGFNCITLPSGNTSLVWAGGSMLYEQTAAAGGDNRMLYRPRGDKFEVLNQAGNSYIASIGLTQSQFFSPVSIGGPSVITPGGMLQINCKNANTKGLTIKMYSGQTLEAKPFDIQDSGGTSKSSIDKDGIGWFQRMESVDGFHLGQGTWSIDKMLYIYRNWTDTTQDGHGVYVHRYATGIDAPTRRIIAVYGKASGFSLGEGRAYGWAIGIYGDAAGSNSSDLGLISNCASLFASSAQSTYNRVNNQYMLYMQNPTLGIAKRYAIYSEGGNNYLGGWLGVGVSVPTSPLQVANLPVYANNAAAIAGSLTAGAFYRTGADPDVVCVVH